MKLRTADLIGAALDWAVAKCEGNPNGWCGMVIGRPMSYVFKPSTNWAQGGPIIEREKITLDYFPDGGHPCGGEWLAQVWDGNGNPTKEKMGATILFAAMRCYVASKLGDEIEVPDELL